MAIIFVGTIAAVFAAVFAHGFATLDTDLCVDPTILRALIRSKEFH